MTVHVDWRVLVISAITLVVLPILTNLISSDVRELLTHWARRLVDWAVSRQPASNQEMREEEWLGQLDETPGAMPKFIWAVGIAAHAPFTSRGARGLPLFRDQLGQALWRLVCSCLGALMRRANRHRLARRATHAFLSQGWQRVHRFLSQPTDVADSGRLVAWCSILLLTIGLLYLGMGWRGVVAFDGTRPWPVLVGWGVMRLTITLNGYRPQVLGSGCALLVVALALAIHTRNYHAAPLWANAVAIGSSVIGATVVIPLLVLLAVFIANLLLWLLIAAGLVIFLCIVVAMSESPDIRDIASS